MKLDAIEEFGLHGLLELTQENPIGLVTGGKTPGRSGLVKALCSVMDIPNIILYSNDTTEYRCGKNLIYKSGQI